MKKPARVALPLVLSLLAPGCFERPELDTDPPRVLLVEPQRPLVPVDVSFRVTFSEPLNEITVLREDEGHTVVIVPRAVVTSAFLSDINSPPLLESRQAAVVPATLTLSDNADVITLKPLSNLLPDAAYTLLISRSIRDLGGNPLFGAGNTRETFRYDFVSDNGPPVLLGTDLGTALVWPNRKRFTATFNQAVRGLSVSTFVIEPLSEGALVPTAQALLISEGRDVATLLLSDEAACERLTPNAEYQLRVGPGLKDDEGEGMEELRIPFTTGPSCDQVPLVVLGAPVVVATDVRATLRFSTNKASSTELRYGITGGPLDCLGVVPCPKAVPNTTSPVVGSSPPAYERAIAIEELVVGEEYAFLLRAQDDVGAVAMVEGSFVTAPLPKIAINEIMGNSPQVRDANGAFAFSDSDGEYVELVNFGDDPVDLSAWTLEIRSSRCTLPSDGPVIEPGEFFLLVPGANRFPYSFYGVDPSQTLSVPENLTRLCGGITNTGVVPVALYAADGRPVDTFTGYGSLTHNKVGRSVERTAPDAPDVESSWCYSREDHGYTPLADNGVMLRGCQ
jgi:hypothetical protein